MGSAHSSQERGIDDEEEQDHDEGSLPRASKPSKEKVLEQEPETLPCRASASPLSPQLSAVGTPRLLGPSIKVWDPCNVLLPPAVFSRGFDADSSGSGDLMTEVLLINHGECGVSLRPDLVGGRWPEAALTGSGERQARALAVFLNSLGVTFSAAYSSPLARARATAVFVCRELGFSEEKIQSSDALLEMSQGQWEGCLRSVIYTPELVSLIDSSLPDFSPPLGESLRQVEFRMIEFLSKTILRIPEKLLSGDHSVHCEDKGLSRHNSANSVQDRDGPQWDLVYRLSRTGMQRKKSGKSRLQFMTTGDHEIEEELSPGEASQGSLIHEVNLNRNRTTSVGVFTHATPIKCLVACLLGCSPTMSMKICIDDSSVTVLQHSLRNGWQIKRLNDTSHLRLL